MKKHIGLIAGTLMLCLSGIICAGCNTIDSSVTSTEQDLISITEVPVTPDSQLTDATVAPNPDISKMEAELNDLGILTTDDLRAGEFISVRETFEILHRFSAGYNYYSYSDYGSDYLMEWYDEDIWEEERKPDNLEDKDKITLMYLREQSVILISELASIDLDKELTRYQALMYITRQLGNTYGCDQYKEELYFTNRNQTIDIAVKKGLISNDESVISDELIPKTEFFQLLYRALYTTISRGGVAGVYDFQYISIFSEENRQLALDEKEE